MSFIGTLKRYPATSEELSGLPITLIMKAPNTNEIAAQFQLYTDKAGQVHFGINKKDPDGKLIGIEGPFSKPIHNFGEEHNGKPVKIQYPLTEGAYSFEAKFAGTDELTASESPSPITILVGQSAGYAILIQGKIENEEGLAAHKKTTNRIYKTLRERGFDKENIRYLNYKSVNAANEEILNKVMVNQTTETILVKQPTITEIEDAFTDLQSKNKGQSSTRYMSSLNDHGWIWRYFPTFIAFMNDTSRILHHYSR
ncbi:hypothetical protein BGS_0301 [Beggiatoa sp. SS]|nr:hypothetical protein BGS_0301 [Beggiatoa sp. SS]